MRKHISTIIAGIIFLTGLSLLLYPTISNFWNSKHQTQAVADYSKQIEKMDDQEKEQALAAAEKYNQTLITMEDVLHHQKRKILYMIVFWMQMEPE